MVKLSWTQALGCGHKGAQHQQHTFGVRPSTCGTAGARLDSRRGRGAQRVTASLERTGDGERENGHRRWLREVVWVGRLVLLPRHLAGDVR